MLAVQAALQGTPHANGSAKPAAQQGRVSAPQPQPRQQQHDVQLQQQQQDVQQHSCVICMGALEVPPSAA
jgi:hypothetical protein